MNGKTAKLLRKLAAKRNKRSPRYMKALKRAWRKLNRHDRAIARKKIKTEVSGKVD